GDDTLLDAGAPGVVEPDDGHAHLQGEIHDLADLLGIGEGERPPEDREVLGEEVNGPTVDPRRARHDPVAEDLLVAHPEVGRLMDHEAVQLVEGSLVDKEGDALARRLLAGRVLAGDPLRPASTLGGLAEAGQMGEPVVESHQKDEYTERGRSASTHPAGTVAPGVRSPCHGRPYGAPDLTLPGTVCYGKWAGAC